MGRVLDRTWIALATAPFRRANWRALLGFVRYVRPGPAALMRYLSQRGSYPWVVTVVTPIGERSVELSSRHDLLTVAEVFCRGDYDPVTGRNIVDIGANIGIASLYFLTRDSEVTVTCFEPNPVNVERLRRTLSGFEGRYRVEEVAVAVESGTGRFRVEDTGRYGRLDPSADMEVETVGIGEALRSIAAQKGPIDLLKIDTEGSEPELVAALPSDVPIGEVLWEDRGRIRRRSRGRRPAVVKRP